MIYSYIINNNEDYDGEDEVELLSNEEISFTEFKNIVKDAFQLCGDTWNSYTQVADKIVEIDDRFFLPQRKAIAYIGMERGDYNDKIRGIYEIKD